MGAPKLSEIVNHNSHVMGAPKLSEIVNHNSKQLASSPGPIPSLSMLHTSRFSVCNIEKKEVGIGPGDEAQNNYFTHIMFIK